MNSLSSPISQTILLRTIGWIYFIQDIFFSITNFVCKLYKQPGGADEAKVAYLCIDAMKDKYPVRNYCLVFHTNHL